MALEKGAMCPHMSDEANKGVEAPPTGLAPVGGVKSAAFKHVQARAFWYCFSSNIWHDIV